MEFFISIDHEGFDHKPDRRQYKDYLDKFKNPRTEVSVLGARVGTEIKKLDILRLAEYICEGRTWTPYIFQICPDWNRRRRLEGLFKSSQVFALDFDDNTTSEEILLKAEQLNIKIALIHHSFSSTEDYKKFRAIILCEQELTDFDEVKKIALGLAYGFNSDKSCVDIARLYFGSKPNSIVHLSPHNINSKDALLDLAKRIGVEKYIIKKKQNLEKPDDVIWGTLELQIKLFSKIPKQKLNTIKRIIAGNLQTIKTLNKKDNVSRYDTVWRQSARLARMPELTGSFISSLVKEAIDNNDYFDDWEYDPDSVINSAIVWAASHADEPF